MKLAAIIQKNQLETLFFEGNYGIEKEGLRTDQQERLALTNHPKALGSRLHHPYIQTDFSEAQPEIVTPVMPSIEESFNWLEAIHDVLHRTMSAEEYVWPYSMPNILPKEEEIPIIRLEDPAAVEYREELAARYGKKLQTISGIHLNFSFSEAFITAVYESQETFSSKKEFANDLYIKLAGNFLKYEWILLYLFGASPYADKSFYDSKAAKDLKQPTDYIRSIRNSSFGYHNHEDVNVSYESLEAYVQDIEYFVETDHLSEDREYYGNARLRGAGSKFREMLDSGVAYVEFRSIDINPLDRLGLSMDQLEFYHLFFMYLVWIDERASAADIEEGQRRNLIVSEENPFHPTTYQTEGLAFLDQMEEMTHDLKLTEKYVAMIKRAQTEFTQPEQSLSARIATIIEQEGYLNHARRLGLQYKDYSVARPYVLNGFEDMELSTQLLMHDAIQLGVETEIMDRADQFLRLIYDEQVEYVRNGNMTSKDTTISHFIMENKSVTKKILAEAGYSVPAGGEYHSIEKAVASYGKYKDQAIVVKPKSTNYGIGISVFKNPPNLTTFKEALEIAFKEDDTVLVEEFISGTEYRFFVLDDKVEAVLLRVPANVVGDGHSTISELVDQKNEDPLRGEHHRTPLARIEKGSLEKLMLKEQGFDFDSVPEKEQIVYLRENSNISTGGDSIDFTEEMHESYNKVAVGIAKALAVKVTGIDLIIPDYQQASAPENPGYSCIEANFNPAMNMHAYVTKGKGRRLTLKVLEMLYPALKNKRK